MATVTVNIISRSKKSLCGGYRFYLLKRWDKAKPVVAFIGINPSKADEIYWDPTVCNCNNLAVQWDYGGFVMLNLFPIYQTSQANVAINSLAVHNNKNKIVIERLCKTSTVDKVIIATGEDRKRDTKSIMQKIDSSKLYCIGKNADGSYLHPSPQALNNYTQYPEPIKI